MKRFNWPIWSALGASLLLASPILAAEPAAKTAGTAKTPAKPAAKIDAQAKTALSRMAETLAKADNISVVISGSYDVVQADGRKVQFSERRTMRLDRPGYLRVEAQESGGRKTVTAFDGTRSEECRVGKEFDGTAATLLDVKENVYGQADLKGSTDDALRYLVQTLGVRLPLAMLFTTTLPAELNQRLTALDYVERDDLSGADHLAGRMTDVDFEIWTTAEGPALPQRLTITYRTATGQPQYRAAFSDWSLNAANMPKPDLDLPADAERIPFLARSAAETKKSKGAAK